MNNKTNNFIFHNRSLYSLRLISSMLNKWIRGIMWKTSSLYVYGTSIYSMLVFLKNHRYTNLQSLMDIVAVDYSFANNWRFEIIYVFWNYKTAERYYFPVFLKGFENLISLSSLYSSANWLEREIWDMFGIKFLMHPDLRRILSDYGFQGHPLRKDFPLVGFTEERYDDLYQSVYLETVETMQYMRYYNFANSWTNWK